MLISKTSQYAIQAMIYLATLEPQTRATANDIARQLGLPSSYLSSIMPLLTRQKLAKSTPGPTGGFSLGRDADSINLMQILSITEGTEFTQQCLLGFKACDPASKCPVHDRWQPVKTKILAFLEKQTLKMLGDAVKSGKYRIHDLPYTRQIQLRPTAG
jgi:Rrf2 family protein